MKECVAMLLAGGQGSRLYVLTQNVAKPAVPYGGKYRIIDFPLSNCVNSGIDTVGVLTQYQPLELNEYIGNGYSWGLDRLNGGVHILPPYRKSSGSDWYSGTANAIYQNIRFIEKYEPKYVLILSGDHIYKMNYSLMLEHHKAHGADCTISVIEVPPEEAPRFGIMSVDEQDRIYKFQEKPKQPDSCLASMGIYIFTWSTLKEYLLKDAENSRSENDFGGDVIPAMLADNRVMSAYRFEGYWKDVGTIDSLWEANMDLLDPNMPLNLWDGKWKIYSRSAALPPHYVSPTARITNSMVCEGCVVAGCVDFSVLFSGAEVAEGAAVLDSIIMPGAVVESGATVQYSIVAENARICSGAKVGERPEAMENAADWGVAVIGENSVVHKNARVAPKAMLSGELGEGEQLC